MQFSDMDNITIYINNNNIIMIILPVCAVFNADMEAWGDAVVIAVAGSLRCFYFTNVPKKDCYI